MPVSGGLILLKPPFSSVTGAGRLRIKVTGIDEGGPRTPRLSIACTAMVYVPSETPGSGIDQEKVQVVPCFRVGAVAWAIPSSDHLIAAVPVGEDTANVKRVVAALVITGFSFVPASGTGASRLRLVALKPGAAPAADSVSTWRTSGARPTLSG